MQPTASSGVRRGEDGDQSTDDYSPSTKRLREVLLGETSAKRPSPSGEGVFHPSSAEELQDVQSTSTDEERLSPIEACEAKYSPARLAHYQSWMDTSWRASEGQTPDAAAVSQDAGLQAAAAREEDVGEEEDDPDEGEGEWEGEWGGAWEGCDDVYAGLLGFAGERVGVERSEEEEEAAAEDVGEDGQVRVAGVATAAAAGLLRATARAALETLDEEPRLHMTRLLQLHKLTQAAGSAAESKVPRSQQPVRPPTAPEAQPLARGCPLGPRGEGPCRLDAQTLVPAQTRKLTFALPIQVAASREKSFTSCSAAFLRSKRAARAEARPEARPEARAEARPEPGAKVQATVASAAVETAMAATLSRK
jgi:hypothetical protein